MKFFGRSKEDAAELEQAQSAEAIEKTTEEVEAEREQKRLAREEKKFLKTHARKRQKLERLVAPVLLIVTLLLSYLIFLSR
jgi:hypothetical protein